MLSHHDNMPAELLIRRRVAFDERDFAELVVWRVPTPVPPTDHGFKYRLVDGARVIGFDNERGKGDHRHDEGQETPYRFVDVDRLLGDFVEAVDSWRKSHGKD
ncbi:toxin-antitoxin system TumE family protein [Methylobacterium sp. Gmos1]